MTALEAVVRVHVMLELSGYLGLFIAAFAAATLLPTQSEAVLAGLLLNGAHSVWILLAVATVGNTLGAVVNWWLGRSLDRFRQRPWFPFEERHFKRARQTYQRWGHWSLLFSWLPFVGDPLTVLAGVLREPLWRFFLIVLVAKGGRYLLVAAATLGWSH